MTYGDYNGDGHISASDIDSWQLDNGGYPGQLENASRYGGGGGGSGGGCLFALGKILLLESGCAVAVGFALIAVIVILGIGAIFFS